MEHASQEQQELFNLCDIRRLLHIDTPTALVPPRSISKLHREAECVMPAASVKLVFEAQLSKPISRLAVTFFNTLIQDADRTVPYSRKRHKKGEVCHYHGRIWVVTGVGQQRVVCYQRNDTSTFIILQHTPDSDTRYMKPCLISWRSVGTFLRLNCMHDLTIVCNSIVVLPVSMVKIDDESIQSADLDWNVKNVCSDCTGDK